MSTAQQALDAFDALVAADPAKSGSWSWHTVESRLRDGGMNASDAATAITEAIDSGQLIKNDYGFVRRP